MIRYAGFLTDEKTGIPLPIAPRANLPPRQPRSPNLERVADLHHPAEGNRKLCNGSESDQALRHSRMQWALYDDHHTGIHGIKLKPVLPTGIAARFRYVSLMVGLYLPDKCIGFQERRQRLDPEVRELDYGGRMLMGERKDVAVDRRMTVTRFLISAAINFGLAAQHTEFDRTLIDKFGDEPNTYAMPLMSRLVELTTRVTGLHESYSASKSEGLLPPQAPKTAKQLLVENIERYETERVRNQSDGFESVAVLLQKSLVQAHRQAS